MSKKMEKILESIKEVVKDWNDSFDAVPSKLFSSDIAIISTSRNNEVLFVISYNYDAEMYCVTGEDVPIELLSNVYGAINENRND